MDVFLDPPLQRRVADLASPQLGEGQEEALVIGESVDRFGLFLPLQGEAIGVQGNGQAGLVIE
jgi:hypothetical protein